MSFSNVGKVWTPETLREYLRAIEHPEWATAVCLHHTAAPSLAQRPQGLKPQHIVNIREFYKEKGWASGPHFFTDEDQIFGMTPPSEKGIHAVSFNRSALGIEVLGDYDSEDPDSGRGKACWETATIVTSILLQWLGLEANERTVLFHRDDPRTTKSCPGDKVSKHDVLTLVRTAHVTTAFRDPQPEDSKPTLPAGKTWERWERRANFWAVPVADFLNAVLSIPYEVITAKLKKRVDGYYYGEELLEGAWFNVPSAETWGSAKELLGLA